LALKSELSSFDCTIEEISLFSCCTKRGVAFKLI